MKFKIILAIILAVAGFLLICEGVARIDTHIVKSRAKDYELIKIDGCEYVLVCGYNRIALAHKGNCTNHIIPRAIITTGSR